ncbi:MAG: hypothetical protein AAGJ80_08235, partial [Cyanobacteria bacterium J06553_1]
EAENKRKIHRDLKPDIHPKRPREDWPDPDKPRYANINRNDERLDTRIEISTAKRLEAFLKKTGLTKKAVVDEAINRLIDTYDRTLGAKARRKKPKK